MNKEDKGGRLCCEDKKMLSMLDCLERKRDPDSGLITFPQSDGVSSLIVAAAMEIYA